MGFKFTSGSYSEPVESLGTELLSSSKTTSSIRLASPSSGRSGADREGSCRTGLYAESTLG